MKESQIINELITAINDAGFSSNIRAVYLYGSRARGDADPRSDIDIAIDCPNMSKANWLKIVDLVEELPTLLEIDFVRFDQATPELQNKILEEGIKHYES